MNRLLLIASIGHRLSQGASLGEALYGAAIDHDAERDALEPVYDPENMAVCIRERRTIAEYFDEIEQHT